MITLPRARCVEFKVDRSAGVSLYVDGECVLKVDLCNRIWIEDPMDGRINIFPGDEYLARLKWAEDHPDPEKKIAPPDELDEMAALTKSIASWKKR